jgi:hypothetical protein
VARASQPWAGGHKPVGLGTAKLVQKMRWALPKALSRFTAGALPLK